MPKYRLREEEEEQPLLVELEADGTGVEITVYGYNIAYLNEDGVLEITSSAKFVPGLSYEVDGYIKVRKI